MKKLFVAIAWLVQTGVLFAQTTGPEVTSWIVNTTGQTGYAGILTNVQKVEYSTSNVYVSSTCIPGYDIGPWAGNPNIPANQNFCFKITRSPQPNSGTAVATPMGHIGVWTNGVSIFNSLDAMTYKNQGIWHQNAYIVEGKGFDNCLGHPAPNGEYHHHVNPTCLYNDKDSSKHSPIIGYSFDGYPVYGAYGWKNTNGTGGITRMKTSYRLRNITQRTTLPNGTVLNSSQYGPDVSSTYPLDYYAEDYEYVAGLGDLDEHNGRFCITPEYPAGTYAYFVTIDENRNPVYPYTLGVTYYGVIPPGNTGPGSGHNTPTETVKTYTGIEDGNTPDAIGINVFPNPFSNTLTVSIPAGYGNCKVSVYNTAGQDVANTENSSGSLTLDLALLPAGIYTLRVYNSEKLIGNKLITKL